MSEIPAGSSFFPHRLATLPVSLQPKVCKRHPTFLQLPRYLLSQPWPLTLTPWVNARTWVTPCRETQIRSYKISTTHPSVPPRRASDTITLAQAHSHCLLQYSNLSLLLVPLHLHRHLLIPSCLLDPPPRNSTVSRSASLQQVPSPNRCESQYQRR